MPGEVETTPLFEALRQRGIQAAFTRVSGADLSFHHTADLASLVPGFRGLREPAADATAIALDTLDVVLVPGVAFTRDGGRLGQGGGFYDRFLARPDVRAFTVGLAFEVQLATELPAEAHDQRVDVVATEWRLYRAGFSSPST